MIGARAPTGLVFLICGLAPAQKDISIEALARAMEGRLGIYARNLATGDQIAINADKLFAIDALTPGLLPDSRPAGAPETRRAGASPRELAERMAHLHRDCPRTLDHPARRSLVAADRALLGAGLSPVVEVGGVSTGLCRAPGIAGYASTPAGELVFAVLASELDSAYTAGELFPEIVESCFRRLVTEFVEKPRDSKPPGLLLASLHESGQDPKLFPASPEASVADLRRGDQRLKFNPGDVARIAVLARPGQAARVTVQWWSPAFRPEKCSSAVLDAARIADSVFDFPVDKLGAWRVRVAWNDVIVLDEKFFVTAK